MKTAHIDLSLPYEPLISVNHGYNRNNQRYGICEEATVWLWTLRNKINQKMNESFYDFPYSSAGVELNIHIEAPKQRGRLPDTSNFRKFIQDVVAATLGLDDQKFSGRDMPAVRVEKGQEPRIYVEITWQYPEGKCEKMSSVRPDSKTAHGPLSKDMQRRLGLKDISDLCIGYGSVYCATICEELVPDDCPMTFHPGQYAEKASPCQDCKKSCPCLHNTPERTEQIMLWWNARKKSTKFERDNWRN